MKLFTDAEPVTAQLSEVVQITVCQSQQCSPKVRLFILTLNSKRPQMSTNFSKPCEKKAYMKNLQMRTKKCGGENVHITISGIFFSANFIKRL